MSTEILTENEKKGELKRVRMPGYGIFLGILMLIFAFLGVSAAYHIVKEIMPIPSVCMVVVALLLYELWRIGRGIWIGRESACWEIGVWNCFFVLSAVLSSSRGEAFANAVPFVVYAAIVFIVAFLMTHLPRMRRWYVFRRQWNSYLRINPHAKLRDLPNPESGKANELHGRKNLKRIFLSVLAWPTFTIGVIMLVLDFLVYSRALAVSYRFRESWSGILSIPGVVFVLYSFGCFVCERREKDAN